MLASTTGAAAARSRAAAAAMATVEVAVGLLPPSSVSSRLRGSSLLSFFK